MESYNFWPDFFDTYQSLSDWMKTLWLIVPPVFILALVCLVGRLMASWRASAAVAKGRLVCSIYRDGENRMHVVNHVAELRAERKKKNPPREEVRRVYSD